MSPNNGLMSPDACHAAWLNLIAHSDAPNAPTYAEGALAYVVANGCANVDAIIKNAQGIQGPVLHAVLSNLAFDKLIANSISAEKFAELPDDSASPWDKDVKSLSANERLAAWLLVNGANPWTVDGNGRDALDLAFRAGSRSLVKRLLRHPGCPSPEEVQARTCDMAGRLLPWLHTAAYQGRLELLRDLIGAGWSAKALDRSGWLPLAWVNDAHEVPTVLSYGPVLNESQKAEVCQAWGRRKTQKLVRANFNLTDLASALDAASPLSNEQREQNERIHKMQIMLAANPSMQTYQYKGWDTDLVKTPEALQEALTQTWGWTYSAPSGVTKGSWSVPAAMLWGHLRGHREEAIEGCLLAGVVSVLAAQDPDGTWLEGVIRPGSTGKQAQPSAKQGGLLWWLVSSQAKATLQPEKIRGLEAAQASGASQAEILKFIEAMWNAPDGRRRGFEEAVAFTKAFTKSSSSSEWLKLVARRWSTTCLNFMSYPSTAWEFEGWRQIMQLGLELSQEAGMALTTAAARALTPSPTQDPETAQAAFAWLLQCLLVPDPFLLSWNGGKDRVRPRLSLRLTAVSAVLAAHRRDPVSYAIPLDCPAPFTPQELIAMTTTHRLSGADDMPAPEVWSAMLREDRLKHALGDAAVVLSPRARM